MTYLLEFLILQAGWFAAVLGAEHGWPLLGPAVCAVLVGRQLLAAERPRALGLATLIVMLIGTAVDSGLRGAGLVGYPNPGLLPAPLAPLWIAGLWALFGTLLGSSLAWLGRKPWLAGLLGAIGGPFSFWSASRLGATSLDSSWSLPALAICWGLLTPLAARLVDSMLEPTPR